MEMPTRESIAMFGKYVHTRFKKVWAIEQGFPENTVIPEAGYTIVTNEETGDKMVVNTYPDSFKIDMASMADVFFYKQPSDPESSAEKRGRKRIPAYSAKPSRAT